MNFQDYAKTLDYRPMNTFPWVENPNYVKGCDDEDDRWMVPMGVVVRFNLSPYHPENPAYMLYGNELAGYRTQGCSDCSRSNFVEITTSVASGWAWVFPGLVNND